jgi:hypothetical protein
MAIKRSELKNKIEVWNKIFNREFKNKKFSKTLTLEWLNRKRELNENISLMLYDKNITEVSKEATPELFAICDNNKGIIWNEIFRLEGRTDLIDD